MLTKGQSGNPNGRKPGKSFADFLRKKKGLSQDLYNAVHPLLKSDDENIRVKAATFLQEARDGRPAQAVQLSDTDGKPLTFSIVNFSELKKPE